MRKAGVQLGASPIRDRKGINKEVVQDQTFSRLADSVTMWVLVASLILGLQTVSGQSTIRWCAISAQEMSKCNAMAQAFSGAAIRPIIQCVSDVSVEGCAQKIGVSGALSD
ncbi:unnamed protein product [Oncorhynchus mykiss]|uniref:Transferrin-like domain-containing protein n=1 Tax=Oncorhynchus mykiss TaxID=8022 RepID=A0A060YTT3_ONCMY|nr:unnamed protein product [Oncorhynchus mykiss]